MSFNGKYYDNVKFTSIIENKDPEWNQNCLRMVTNVMFTQMSSKKINKLFKENTLEAIVKEYTQLDNITFMGPENPYVLTPEQKRKLLRAANLIKEKRCSKIKGRTCTYGSTQRGYISRVDA